MIKQLSIHRFLLILLAASFSFNAKAQFPATINTSYSTAGGLGYVSANGGSLAPSYITFVVQNTNPFPIRLTAVNFYHVAGPLGNGASMNDATYTLWSTLSLSGPPTIAPANGWSIVASGAPVNTPTTGMTEVISGIDFIIPSSGCPGDQIRFALVCSDTMWHYCTTAGAYTPPTFSSMGVKVTGTGMHFGVFPGVSQVNTEGFSVNTVPPSTAYTAFRGGITVDTNNIIPSPPIVTVDRNPVCVGDSVILKASTTPAVECVFPNPEYEWTWTGGGSAKGDSIKVQVNETTQFNCVLVSKGRRSNPTSVKVVVVDPEPPLVTGRFQYCVGDQYEPVEVQADSFQWYYVEQGGSALPVAPTINTNLGPQRDTYYVAQWKDGCFSDRTRVIFTAAIKPIKPIVTTPLYYCEGQPAPPLEAIGNEMLWYYFPTGGVPTAIAPTPPTSVKNKFDYYVANTNDGCEGPREHIEVFVEFKPNGLIVASRDRLCEGDTVTLSYYGSAFDSSAFDWKIPAEGIYVDGDKEKGPFTVRFDRAGLHDITLVVGSGACFSDLYSQPFQVDSIPFAIITAKQNVCESDMELVSLEYYDETIDSFRWDFGFGSRTTHYATDQGPYGVIWDEPGEPVIALTIIQGLCADTLYDTIQVRPHPDARIDVDMPSSSGIYCAGDSIRVRAHVINSGTEYTWGPSRYFDTYSGLPAAYAIVDFTSYVTLNIEDQYGCKNSDSILIKTEPCCKLTFPTAFSPNNDGTNDRFRLLNVREYDNYNRTNALNYDVRNFRVMNRWGVTVFESNNEIAGWDGNFNGEPQDMGTYYWFISYMCGDKLMNEKGEVVLVR